MKRLPIRLLRFLVLAMFLIRILPARAQQSVVQLPDIYVSSDNYSIHVSHKGGAHPSKVPVLLIHGSWVNSQTWDFPGRSVMDYLAVRGYDVYALDLRGMGGSVPAPATPTDYFPIDILGRVTDAAAVAGYIRNNTGRVPVVIGWSLLGDGYLGAHEREPFQRGYKRGRAYFEALRERATTSISAVHTPGAEGSLVSMDAVCGDLNFTNPTEGE